MAPEPALRGHALQGYGGHLRYRNRHPPRAASSGTKFENPALQEAAESDKRPAVVSTLRCENLEDIKEIGRAMKDLAKAYSELNFALSLHLNPRVCEAVLAEAEHLPNIIITDPLLYDQST